MNEYRNLLKFYNVEKKYGVITERCERQLAYISTQITHGPILEFGCWLGRSTYVMAKCKKPEIKIFTVDLFGDPFLNSNKKPFRNIKFDTALRSNPDVPKEEIDVLQSIIDKNDGDTLEATKYVLQDYLDTIEFYKMNTANFQISIEPEFVFIDAGHTYEECRSDIEKVIIFENTLIAVHDYDQEDVARACKEMAKKYNRELIVVGIIAWIIDKNKIKMPLIQTILENE